MRFMLFLKLFFATAVPFGLLMSMLFAGLGALMGVVPNMPFSVAQGIVGGVAIGGVAGLLFGITVAAVGGALHFSQTTDPRVCHRRMLVLDASRETAKNMCLAAIKPIANASVQEESPTQLRVTAKTGITWRSWGDLITCRIETTAPNRQTVAVESRPWLRTTLVDYGSNLRNVDTIASFLLAQGARMETDASGTA